MADTQSSVFLVLLVAAENTAWEALQPTREALESFGLTWARAQDARSAVLAEASAVIVASVDGVLPGSLAAKTPRPVVRVPVADIAHSGTALLSDPATADLPAADAPFATVAIGEAGAKNAALFVVSVLALDDARLRREWLAFRQRQTEAVLASPPLSIR